MRILTVLGARPQFIKAAAVSRVLAQADGVDEVIVHTGQHYDANMSDAFFDELEIPRPAHRLTLKGSTHGAMTGGMLADIEAILLDDRPDWVMVYGDTNSTIAGALAASKLHIPVAHVEAGLRSFNMRMPEEVNRIVTDRLSSVLFCPTRTAERQLAREGFADFGVDVVRSGDVMQDAALYYARTSDRRSDIIDRLDLDGSDFVLATVHRAENTDDEDRLRGIVRALEEIHRDTPVVLPVHPRTAKMFGRYGIEPAFNCIEPVGYFSMIELLKHASLVATDSGGLQKEAYFFSNPCVTLRDETEWTELVDHGVNRLAGADPTAIRAAVDHFRTSTPDFSADLYGGGHAAEAIARFFTQTVG